MGADCIEIPVGRVEVRSKSTNQLFVSLMPECVGPYIEETMYADDKPYITTNCVTILFKKRQVGGNLTNLDDWSPITDLIKRGDAVFRLITPTTFENIDLEANQMLYNKFIEMFEFRGSIVKKEVV
jgi:hypothetical protein|nr:MAG TPA: hypothetical protein [Caudoviricetes sp.]DAW78030.1 MAG TPA: hypothetical protein [Caudoviricetes sp.]